MSPTLLENGDQTQRLEFTPSVSSDILFSIHGLTLFVLIFHIAFRCVLKLRFKKSNHSHRDDVIDFILMVFSCTFSVVSLSILIFVQLLQVVNEQNLLQFRFALGGVCMLIPGTIVIIYERKLEHKDAANSSFKTSLQERGKQFLQTLKILILDKMTYFGILTILLLQILVPFISIIFIPGVKFSMSSSFLRNYLSQFLTLNADEENLKKIHTLLNDLENSQFLTFYILILSGSLLSMGLNGFFGYGEEKCWREFLWNYYWRNHSKESEQQKSGSLMKFIQSSLWIGFIHGVWHAPMILLGHNYGMKEHVGSQWKGVLMMTASCTFLSPLLCFFTEYSQLSLSSYDNVEKNSNPKANGILAGILHGIFNSS
ncbi:hypothetical protein C9374_009841 [Naegleria lovaniensis]|uniref:Uncharacterized protein n=1 Tax=Naegleria lovaniensis TaxID=51637 RepID=A0AA88GHC8_NAELO|nr:uncharacterized protein C9374_009841 [Naegleria lovaniensis]KAG2375218.1 hypothetical protein C9374_009841 [Naegleria lovaniensis]